MNGLTVSQSVYSASEKSYLESSLWEGVLFSQKVYLFSNILICSSCDIFDFVWMLLGLKIRDTTCVL